MRRAIRLKGWFASSCHRLKHEPPAETIGTLRLLQAKVSGDERGAQLDNALFYLQHRLDMLDYAHFRRLGYPIGSGSVESGHKVVVQQRLKGAGMRWAEANLDPMLALRDLVCNDRWEVGWQQIELFQQEQQLRKRLQRAEAKKPPPSQPITFARLKAAGLLPADEPPDSSPAATARKPWRPAPDHPWRNDKWPTKDAWRWKHLGLAARPLGDVVGALLGRIHDGVTTHQVFGLLARQLPDPFRFLFGLGEDTLFLRLHPVGPLDLFRDGDTQLVDNVKDLVLVDE
jgi:hypothetical protein